jgi:hypothetical protein
MPTKPPSDKPTIKPKKGVLTCPPGFIMVKAYQGDDSYQSKLMLLMASEIESITYSEKAEVKTLDGVLTNAAQVTMTSGTVLTLTREFHRDGQLAPCQHRLHPRRRRVPPL